MSDFPKLAMVGLSGVLVTFAEKMDNAANCAALAFRAAVAEQDWPEVRETSMSLVSVYLVIDLVTADISEITQKIKALLDTSDWYAAPLPQGRTLWHIPTVYGTDIAPQLEEAAEGLKTEFPLIEINYLALDLSIVEAPTKVYQWAKKMGEPQVLINNAGFGTYGFIEEIPIEKSIWPI